MSDAEEGIARAQTEAVKAEGTQGDRLQAHQRRGIAYVNERIVVFLAMLAVLGLFALWLSSDSALLLYGSLVAVILLLLFWGWVRIKNIERQREERAQQAEAWSSKDSG